MYTLQTPSPKLNRAVTARRKPTLGELMRQKGAAWAAACIVRRHGIRHRHAVLVVGILGVDREGGR
jgi:hypothetical protein